MKISGNKRNGHYAANNERHQAPQTSRVQKEQPVNPRAAKAALKRKKMKRARNILTAVLVVVVALLAVLYCVYKLGVKPPHMRERTTIAAATDGTTPLATSEDRKGTQYTFVILGFDDGNGNSDTIMVANFDADNHRLSVINIPRDTLVNVKWSLKKANTLYSSGGGITGVTNGLSDILGFQVDFYVKVNLKAFAALVDAVGGVDFDIPVNMNYDDDAQDLHIHFSKGMKHLNGEQALLVVRDRNAYSTADIGRIGTQQSFLKSAAEQILKNQKKLNVTELANIFMSDVETDLDLGSVIWLGKEFYKMDSKDVTFTTIPANYWDSVNKTSYVTIYVDDWLTLLNDKINPYKDDITAKDLSILTRNAKGILYVTNGVYAGKKTWGTGSSASTSNDDDAAATAKTSTKPSSSSAVSSPSSKVSDALPSPSDADTGSDDGSAGTGSPDTSPAETGGDPSLSPSPIPSDIPDDSTAQSLTGN
jgi:polyisoprenyl-teichoic acid--peptidoglycan teichoic acid transferase